LPTATLKQNAKEAAARDWLQTGRHTPVVAMTANAIKGDQEKCLDAGMDGYVTKPIKPKVMLDEIDRVMKKIHAE
jgi:CheY-like chemotaxis protein